MSRHRLALLKFYNIVPRAFLCTPSLQENPKIAIHVSPPKVKKNLKHGYRHPIYYDNTNV